MASIHPVIRAAASSFGSFLSEALFGLSGSYTNDQVADAHKCLERSLGDIYGQIDDPENPESAEMVLAALQDYVVYAQGEFPSLADILEEVLKRTNDDVYLQRLKELLENPENYRELRHADSVIEDGVLVQLPNKEAIESLPEGERDEAARKAMITFLVGTFRQAATDITSKTGVLAEMERQAADTILSGLENHWLEKADRFEDLDPSAREYLTEHFGNHTDAFGMHAKRVVRRAYTHLNSVWLSRDAREPAVA